MIVVDSSAAVHALTGSRFAPWVDEQLLDEDLHAPHLLDVEVVNALRGLTAGGKVMQADARGALDEFAALAIRKYAHTLFLERVWELRAHASPYDAVYIALAEALDAPLVTTDLRLARTRGHRAHIVAPE